MQLDGDVLEMSFVSQGKTISIEQLFDKCYMQIIESFLLKSQLRWAVAMFLG